MYKAFGIVNSSGRNIYVDGMQDYRQSVRFLSLADTESLTSLSPI